MEIGPISKICDTATDFLEIGPIFNCALIFLSNLAKSGSQHVNRPLPSSSFYFMGNILSSIFLTLWAIYQLTEKFQVPS